VGIANKLIDYARDFALNNEMKSIVLEVRIDNTLAINLYQKNGFLKTKILSQYYKDGSDGLRMVKVI
jgi:ribosomal-protein-alanine N-acetyltransferase